MVNKQVITKLHQGFLCEKYRLQLEHIGGHLDPVSGGPGKVSGVSDILAES